jgi:hypothetical protein
MENMFSKESALRSIFEIKCYGQSDNIGHVIISWFGSTNRFAIVSTSETHMFVDMHQFHICFTTEQIIFEHTKYLLSTRICTNSG